MNNPDFMNVLRMCAKCRLTDETVSWSDWLVCFICDECYTHVCDEELDRALDETND